MAYSQSKKLSAQERKLLSLRTQLYGKTQPVSSVKTEKPSAFKFASPAKDSAPTLSNTHSETAYLRKDLQKIGLLASLIFTVQALLWFAVHRSGSFFL